MKSWIKSLKKVQWELNVLLGLAVAVFLFLHKFGVEFPINLGVGLVELAQQIALAYVGGYVFWFVADHWSSQKEEATEIEQVERALLNVFRSIDSLCRNVYNQLDQDFVSCFDFGDAEQQNVLGTFDNFLEQRGGIMQQIVPASITVAIPYLLFRPSCHFLLSRGSKHVSINVNLVLSDMHVVFHQLNDHVSTTLNQKTQLTPSHSMMQLKTHVNHLATLVRNEDPTKWTRIQKILELENGNAALSSHITL